MQTSILFVGDLVPNERSVQYYKNKDENYLFGSVCPIIKKADFSIVNYEAPIIFGEEKPLLKSGPNLSSFKETMDVVKKCGFDMITLANNHFRDYGQKGVENTLTYANEIGLHHVGGGKDYEKARTISYQSIGDKRFAFINVCENEYSIATDEYGGSNPYDLINIYHDIMDAKSKTDYVILIIHGGIEHFQLPSPRMKREYRFFIDLGADAIINAHQHCISGYEIYNGKPIFYGIGNFHFDRKAYANNGMWDKGLMVNLFFDEEEISFRIFPISQCGKEPKTQLLKDDICTSEIEMLNEIISDNVRLTTAFDDWCQKKSNQMISRINPFGFNIVDKVYKRGILGNIYRKKRIRIIKNLLYCESHYDVMKQVFRRITQK